MELIRTLVSVVTHGEGHPTKVLLSGIPHFRGKTMEEKRQHIQKNYDGLRLALCREPRGHDDQSAAIITEPVSEQAALGFLTMDTAGHWADMSVSTAIAVVTVASHYGIIEVGDTVTDVMLDTPSGLVTARATAERGVVTSVAIRNVPSFFVTSTTVDVPGLGTLPVDIAFGGNFFGFVRSEDVGIKVTPANGAKLAQIAIAIRDALNDSVPVQHPDWSYINRIPSVIIDDAPDHPNADIKCVCVFGEEGAVGIDRSPCGTGLSARMAMLHHKGLVPMGQEYGQESIVGTLFRGRLVDSGPVGNYQGLTCEITGRAYMTGLDIATVDPSDPLRYGFTLS